MPSVFMFYLLCAITECPPHTGNDAPLAPVQFSNLLPPRVSPRLARRSHDNALSNGDPPVVSTSLGDVQGRYMESRGGRAIAAFQGIPYALPPVGDLRFRNPVPVTFWKDVLIANKTRKDCLQIDFSRMFQVRGVEDCLHLNVFTPADQLSASQGLKNRTKNLLPVIIFIHGGGWMSMSSSIYGPRYLLDKNVVLVTFNFRLGVLGFLSTGDEVARGNFGMKDQLTAMKWVADHISSFGGDPKKITLVGESTGAGSAALHMASPLTSKVLPASAFQGAILLSGSSYNHWAIMNDTLANTKAIAKRMFCPTGTSYELVDCLRTRDPYMVVGQQLQLWMFPAVSRLLFGPVIESPVDNPDAFLVEAPQVSYSRNAVKPIPVIAGVTHDEGGMFAANIYLIPFLFAAINSNWNKMASYAMAYDNQPLINSSQVSSKISKFYFNGKRWSFNNRDKIIEVLGDRTITTGVYQFLQHHSKIAPTYGYVFSYPSNLSLLNNMGLRNSEWGVSHGDELPLIFSMDDYFTDSNNPKDLAISQFLVNVLTNFATDRQPLPKNEVEGDVTWSPILNPKYMEVLDINVDKRAVPFPFGERMKFWESLHLQN